MDTTDTNFEEEVSPGGEQKMPSAKHEAGVHVGKSRRETLSAQLQGIRYVYRHTKTVVQLNQDQIDRAEKMHAEISGGVRLNFNYCCFLSIASIIAGLGLITDSATTVISSMLLSPIMSPVVGMSYGLVVWDLKLVKRAVLIEVASIVACIIFGVIIGLTTGWTDLAQTWATEGMKERGETQALLAGLPVAFVSGLGVGLSVLNKETSSLVGVAISASLLPPAVNSGILWIYAAMSSFHFEGDSGGYENHDNENYVRMGAVSLTLTVSNVILVWIGAALMFRLKEVLPVEKDEVLWNDLKNCRRICQNRYLLDQSAQDTGIPADSTRSVDMEEDTPVQSEPT